MARARQRRNSLEAASDRPPLGDGFDELARVLVDAAAAFDPADLRRDTRHPSAPELLREDRLELAHCDPGLLARVALSDRYRVRRQSVAIHGDAVGSAGLVLPAIPPPNRALLVVVDAEVLAEPA